MMNLLRILKEGTLLSKGYRKLFHVFLQPVFSKFVLIFLVDNRKIVFDNFGGKGYGDNPKFIADELLSRKAGYKLVWLVDNLSNEAFPDGIEAVKIDSIRALFERSTAKVWIDNIRHLHPVKKKENQIYIQTWHAPFSAKMVEGDAEESLGEKYVKSAKYDGKICDAILANSLLQEVQYKRAFWLNPNIEVLRSGLPRNDYLIRAANNQDLQKHLRAKFNFIQEDKYILYAPTFRDDYSIEGYKIDFEGVVSAFEKLTDCTCHIVVRLHPNVSIQSNFIQYNDKIISGTAIPNMQELSVSCDFVISDYSTSVFDFVILGKPAFICALDLEHYRSVRGLLPEFDEFPFPLATSNQGLIYNIKTFDRRQYNKNIKKYFDLYPIYDKGNASKEVVDWLLGKINDQCIVKYYLDN